jgi:RNA polymerase subunit RPABC4/transcription elongation factor Spt4
MLCHNCGHENYQGANFCRFCGTKMVFSQPQMTPSPEFTGERQPYSWKTDEFQVTQGEARKTQQITQSQFQQMQQPMPQSQNTQQFQQQNLTFQGQQYIAGNYRCPRCGTNHLPLTKREISTAGWVTFAVLLLTTGILFWIGLLIREDVRYCPICSYRMPV